MEACGRVVTEDIPAGPTRAPRPPAFEQLVALVGPTVRPDHRRDALRVQWKSVTAIIDRVVAEEQLTDSRFDSLTELRVDEILLRERRRFLTIVVDQTAGATLWSRRRQGRCAPSAASLNYSAPTAATRSKRSRWTWPTPALLRPAKPPAPDDLFRTRFHVVMVRHEAQQLRRRVKDLPAGLSRQIGEADPQPDPEVWVRALSSSGKAGA